ncbi:MAG: exodeoxyribonuclease VII small subunit [Prevotellaceae bacterium]|jgi:exodeoxyribonuclease VII small subunit|nr:exodeoxyribonuclease VII small subunit [Prevotellaceae bacterium]
MSETIKYSEAFEELKQIVSDIDSGKISIDDLAEKVKRAEDLTKICKSKLNSTEENVNQIIKELENPRLS